MNSQTNSIGDQSFGYGFSGVRSAAALAEQGTRVSIEPIIQNTLPSSIPRSPTLPSSLPSARNNLADISFPVNENSIPLISARTSPLETLVQTNSSPVFTTQHPPENRMDEIMEKLLRHGYLIDRRVYVGTVPNYFMAKTRLGDPVFIRINDPQYRATFPVFPNINPNDVQMEKKTSVILVPQDVKMGILQCLNYDICGAAFICNDSICITERKTGTTPKNTTFVDENFVLRSGNIPFNGARVGRSLVAYPIVNLSEILSDPRASEERISLASQEIIKNAFDRLESYNQDFIDSIIILQNQSNNLTQLVREVEQNMDRDIQQLEKAYNKIKDISPDHLSDEDQATYYTIQRELRNLKELQIKFINAIANSMNTSGMIRMISSELRSYIDPILNQYKNI